MNTRLVLQEACENSPCDIDPVVIADNGNPNILAEERKQKVLKAKQEREYANLKLAS